MNRGCSKIDTGQRRRKQTEGHISEEISEDSEMSANMRKQLLEEEIRALDDEIPGDCMD